MKQWQRGITWCLLGCGVFLTSQVALGQQRAATKVLPLVRLKLYETGVAYFERQGELNGTTSLPVPTPHLDDALNSLVIWSQGEGASVDAISFQSTTTEDGRRALSGWPPQGEGEFGFLQLVEGLRGAVVRIVSGGKSVEGRILATFDAENSGYQVCETSSESNLGLKKGSADNCVKADEFVVSVVSTRSEILRFRARDIQAIVPVDGDDARRLQMAAEVPTGAMQALSVKGRASAPVSLGYIAESPLWRASYRIVLAKDPQQNAKLQGWALIHNDTDEAWKNLSVELISGQPDSFLFPFAAPRYSHRRLVTPEEQLPSVRQLGRVSADDLWDQGQSYSSSYGFGVGVGSAGGLGLAGIGEGGGGVGESALLSIGDLAQMVPAEGDGVGALYRYALPEKVALGAHQSTLLPLLDKSVGLKRVTEFAPGQTSGSSVLIFKNDTGQTLPAGVVAVFQAGAFSGETALPRLSAGVTGRMVFGVDLDVELQEIENHVTDVPSVLRYLGHAPQEPLSDIRFSEHYVRRTATSYQLHNRSGEDRTVQIRMDLVNNSKLSGADKVVVSPTDRQTYAEFLVKAGQSRKVMVTSEQGLVKTLTDVDKPLLVMLSKSSGIEQGQRDKIEKVVAQMDELSQRSLKKKAYQAAILRYTGELSRLQSSTDAVARLRSKKEARALAAEILKTQKRVRELEEMTARIHVSEAATKVQTALEALNEPSE